MSYKWDNKKPTAQMLGRWQPFHDGHYALFEEIIKKFIKKCLVIYFFKSSNILGAQLLASCEVT